MSGIFGAYRREENRFKREAMKQYHDHIENHARDKESNEDRITELERRLDRLSLACQALWEIAREDQNLRDDDIYRKMIEIDIRDGCEDERMGPSEKTCRHCRRETRTSLEYCLYCGEYYPPGHVME